MPAPMSLLEATSVSPAHQDERGRGTEPPTHMERLGEGWQSRDKGPTPSHGVPTLGAARAPTHGAGRGAPPSPTDLHPGVGGPQLGRQLCPGVDHGADLRQRHEGQRQVGPGVEAHHLAAERDACGAPWGPPGTTVALLGKHSTPKTREDVCRKAERERAPSCLSQGCHSRVPPEYSPHTPGGRCLKQGVVAVTWGGQRAGGAHPLRTRGSPTPRCPPRTYQVRGNQAAAQGNHWERQKCPRSGGSPAGGGRN